MRHPELAILYAPDGGHPFTVVRLTDRALLLAVAEAAISEAEQRVASLREADEFLGMVQAEASARTRRILTLLLPELRVGDSRPRDLFPEQTPGPTADDEPSA